MSTPEHAQGPTSDDHGHDDHDHDHGPTSDDHGHGHDDHGHGHGHGHDHGTGLWARLKHAIGPHSHDAADSIDDELEGSAEGIRAVKISLAILGATSLLQLAVFIVTNSTALLADTIHNFSDAMTAIPLWVAFVLSRRAANRRYTYGYGRAEDLAGVFIVLMITASAILAGYESISKLINGATVTYPYAVGAAGVLGFIGNELVAKYRIRVGRKIGSAALVADGVHARTDGFTSLAVLVGAVGVLLGFPLADPIIGILITVTILVVLRGAVRDIYRRLMDAVDPEVTTAAENTLLKTPGVVAVDRVRLRWIGHRIAADAEIVVSNIIDVVAAHDIATVAHHNLLHEVPKLSDVTIHFSPQPVAGVDHHAAIAHH